MPAKSGNRIERALIARPRHVVEMFGGPETLTIEIGSMVRVHPCADLFMRGAKCAEVRRIRELDGGVINFDVRPYVAGKPIGRKLFTLRPEWLLIDELDG